MKTKEERNSGKRNYANEMKKRRKTQRKSINHETLWNGEILKSCRLKSNSEEK